MNYKINKDNFTVRKENNGTYSFLNKTTMKIVFLNKVASFIFENDDIDNLEDLMKKMHDRFDISDDDMLKEDCLTLLSQLEAMDVIELYGKEDKIFDQIRIAGEGDYKTISNYILQNIKKTGILCSYTNTNELSGYAIRARQFTNREFNYIYYGENGRIQAIVTLGVGASVSSLSLVNIIADINKPNIVKKILEYAFAENKDLHKIRIMLKDEKKNQNLINYITGIGFSKEAVLKQEYADNKDLLCYSLFK